MRVFVRVTSSLCRPCLALPSVCYFPSFPFISLALPCFAFPSHPFPSLLLPCLAFLSHSFLFHPFHILNLCFSSSLPSILFIFPYLPFPFHFLNFCFFHFPFPLFPSFCTISPPFPSSSLSLLSGHGWIFTRAAGGRPLPSHFIASLPHCRSCACCEPSSDSSKRIPRTKISLKLSPAGGCHGETAAATTLRGVGHSDGEGDGLHWLGG